MILKQSNELIALDKAAFKLVESLPSTSTNLLQVANKQQQAIAILTSVTYIKTKNQIMLPIDALMSSISQRTHQQIDQQSIKEQHYLLAIYLLAMLVFGLFVFLVFNLRYSILMPIYRLIKSFNAIKNGQIVSRLKTNRDDELSDLTQQFFDMYEQLQLYNLRLQLALDHSGQYWFEYEPHSDKTIIDQRLMAKLGYKYGNAHSTFAQFKQQVHPQDLPQLLTNINNCVQHGEVLDATYRRKNIQGDWLWMHSVGKLQQKPVNGNVRLVGLHQDINEQHYLSLKEQIHQKISDFILNYQASEAIFSYLTEQLMANVDVYGVGIFELDAHQQYFQTTYQTNLSAEYCQLMLAANTPTTCSNFFTTNKPYCILDKQQLLATDANEQLFIEAAQVELIWMGAIFDERNNLKSIVSVLFKQSVNATEQIVQVLEFIVQQIQYVLQQKKYQQQLLLAKNVYSQSHDAILITDEHVNTIDVNDTFTQLTGYTRAEVVGKNPHFLDSGKHDASFFQAIWDSITNIGYWQGSFWNKKKDGSLFISLVSISKIENEQHQLLNYVAMYSDITKIMQQQETLELYAHFDPLTKLPNRILLHDRFTQAVAFQQRHQKKLAVCFVDLDNFKVINDRYGHDIGDELLIQVAERIKTTLRDVDTVSRHGGDEFILLLSEVTNVEHCQEILIRLHQHLAQPYDCRGHHCQISVSTGVSFYPDDVDNLDTLIRHADQAMYQSKQAGRNRFCFYDVNKEQAEETRHVILNELKLAYEQAQFRLFYQPKVNMETGLVFGAEALIRWQHPERGILSPIEFLPHLEGQPLEYDLGFWVISQGIQQLVQWQAQKIPLSLSVNVSSNVLLSDNFYQKLAALISQYQLQQPKYLQLEILESSALGDIDLVEQLLERCREQLGIQIALDDFGTGYSTLTHLRKLSVDTLKIDQSFIRDFLDHADDYAIVDGILKLAAAFERETIAEGVESITHGKMLLLMGCTHAQGYVIAKPMSITDFTQWLSSYTPMLEWVSFAKAVVEETLPHTQFLQIVFERWWLRFNNCITQAADLEKVWPVMNELNSHFANWIKLAQKQQLFSTQWLTELEQHVQPVFQHALQIKQAYSTNNKVDLSLEREKISKQVNALMLYLASA